MKTLDLNSPGLEEMTTLEMKETDGGLLLVILAVCAVTLLVSSCVNSPVVINPEPDKPAGGSQPDSSFVK